MVHLTLSFVFCTSTGLPIDSRDRVSHDLLTCARQSSIEMTIDTAAHKSLSSVS